MSSGDNPQPDLKGAEASKKSVNGKTSGEPPSRHASVTDLELAFAQNPDSSAYVDLCLAYIEQGRFMEAMVICKKGIKAHPESIEARVLLARVYAAQKKYKKALQELDDLIEAHADRADAHLARGKMRIESGDAAGGIQDLKRAIDLTPSLEEASELLRAQGVEYPEKPKEPDPAPLAYPYGSFPPGAVIVQPYVGPDPRGASMPRIVVRPSSFVGGTLPPGAAGSSQAGAQPRSASQIFGDPMGPIPAERMEVAQARAASGISQMSPYAAAYPIPSLVPQSALPYPAMVPRLEGEVELEELANEVAEEKPDRGKAKTSITLAAALLLIGTLLIVYRFSVKSRVEAIDRLTQDAVSAFNQDTYGSYKTAAGYFEQILERHDSTHPLTLGRLAHCYAILWGEHGETTLKSKLDAILARAETKAPDVSHTVAARGLAILYDGKDRQSNAAKAREHLAPIVQKARELDAAPSYAHLTLAISELELGNYEAATQALGNVKQVLPGSVRAKVWHARAAFRASRFGTSEAAFAEALRAQPNHPGARAGLALVKMVRGDLNGAAENIIRFDELPEKEISYRDRALAEFARSEVLRAAGEESKAVGAYENAVRFDPGNADFPYGLGKSFLDNDKARDALPHLKKAVEMEKTRWTFLLALAEAEMQVDDYKAAEAHVEDAIRKAPSFLEATLAKARLLRRTKNPETEAYLKKVLEEWPSAEADVNLELGRYFRALGRLDDAKTALERAIERMGGYSPTKQGEIYLSYAKLMQDRREDEIALKGFKQAAESGNMEAHFRIAQQLARGNKDERAEAKRSCERYLAAGSTLRYSAQARELCDQIR